jgi:hypothetical protein
MKKTQEILKEWWNKEMEMKEIVEKHVKFIEEKEEEIFSKYGVGDVYFDDLNEEDKKAIEILEKHKDFWLHEEPKEFVKKEEVK